MKQKEVIDYIDEYLSVEKFSDYCPNGMQVEGDNREVEKICLAVSISEELIEKAIAIDADLILAHHGLIWNIDSRVVRGPLRRKLKLLLDHEIAVAAYHFPLDRHPVLGNNVQLAKRLQLTDLEEFGSTPDDAEGVIGRTSLGHIGKLSEFVERVLERKPMVLPFGPSVVSKVALVTGGAQGRFPKAIEAGADCYITGEASERNYTMSKDHRVHYIAAGHYATERFGIKALGSHIGDRFGIRCDFIEIDNPI